MSSRYIDVRSKGGSVAPTDGGGVSYDVPQKFFNGNLVMINSFASFDIRGALAIVIHVRDYEGSQFRTYEVYAQKHGKRLLRHTEIGHAV